MRRRLNLLEATTDRILTVTRSSSGDIGPSGAEGSGANTHYIKLDGQNITDDDWSEISISVSGQYTGYYSYGSGKRYMFNVVWSANYDYDNYKYGTVTVSYRGQHVSVQSRINKNYNETYRSVISITNVQGSLGRITFTEKKGTYAYGNPVVLPAVSYSGDMNIRVSTYQAADWSLLSQVDTIEHFSAQSPANPSGYGTMYVEFTTVDYNYFSFSFSYSGFTIQRAGWNDGTSVPPYNSSNFLSSSRFTNIPGSTQDIVLELADISSNYTEDFSWLAIRFYSKLHLGNNASCAPGYIEETNDIRVELK